MGILETLGPKLTPLAYKMLLGFVIIVSLTILFFAQKYMFIWWKKRKSYKIIAVVYNPDGSFFVDKIGKFRTQDNIDKMVFLSSQETMPVINPKYVKSNTVTLWRYGIGQYAVVNPAHWINLDPKKFKIELINMQMKNFAYLEQRAAISRWAYIKEFAAKYGPYITFVILGIVTGVVCWFMLKTALDFISTAIAQRTIDCSSLLGASHTSVPTS